MRISPITPIMGAIAKSHSPSNANLLTQYRDYADVFYGSRSDPAPATPLASDQPARPLTRALPNLKSAGVFSYLRGNGRSRNAAGARSSSANLRDSARVAAEVPIMPPMAQTSDQLAAIHDDARRDNAIQVDAPRRTRHPGTQDGAQERQMTRLAPVPDAPAGEPAGNRKLAIRQRNSFMLNLRKVSDEIYSSHIGAYAPA